LNQSKAVLFCCLSNENVALLKFFLFSRWFGGQ
jgi:hypothetical protein